MKQRIIAPIDAETALLGLKIVQGPHAQIGDLVCQVVPLERKGKVIRCQTPFGPKLIAEENLKNCKL